MYGPYICKYCNRLLKWNRYRIYSYITPFFITIGYGFILGVIIEIQSKSLYFYRLGAISYIILAIMSFFLSQLLYPNSLSIKEEVVESE